MIFNGGKMKRIILTLAFLLTACSQETPLTPQSIVITQTLQATLPPTDVVVEEGTSIPATELPATDPPPVVALPPGPITIVALGDSLTLGDGDDTGHGYPGRLLDMVNTIRPGSTITNLGQSGWNSDALINGDQGLPGQLPQALGELETAVTEGRGAVALVWIGSNDLWYLYEYGEGSDENDDLDAEHFAANMDMILSQLRATGAQVIVALLDDQSKRPVALRGEAFTSITPDELNRMSLQAMRYNEIIAEKAAQYGALTVDFYSTDIFTNPATLYDDGNHPNAAGYDIIAQKWFDALGLLLK
jgi:lysophospholipase L1-like esterase